MVQNSIFCLAIHPDAKPRAGVDRAKDRVEFLIKNLADAQEKIIIPMPAFAEFLVLAGAEGPKYLEIIKDNSIFRLEPFDERAAIELATAEIKARKAGNKRGSVVPFTEWQKVKFDRQITSIAKVHGVSVLYSDDPDIKSHGDDMEVKVVSLAELPLPPAVQQPLFPAPTPVEAPDGRTTEAPSNPAAVQGSGSGPTPSEAGAEAKAAGESEKKTSGEVATSRTDDAATDLGLSKG